jgi:hypothetical protein
VILVQTRAAANVTIIAGFMRSRIFTPYLTLPNGQVSLAIC